MDIAIIGMAGRFPEAESLDDFFSNLCAGRDSIRKLSEERLRSTTIPLSNHYQLMAYLDNIDRFDHNFFNISLGEAQHMDPHQRIILEIVYEAFENAGYSHLDFAGSETALFVADNSLEYFKLSAGYDPTLLTGNLNPIVAGRVARFFDLRGEAMMIDTACSSSLVAIHQACLSLESGSSTYALVCGVKVRIFPENGADSYNIGIGSSDGKTKSYSSEASGTGSGEAAACILLKPLTAAIESRDIIHAVIKGSAVNQDAALSGSLTSPSSIAQSNVIRKAWKKAGITPTSISYIEGHGTATKLGDPIEVQGITLAFQDFTEKKSFCALSSVKSNIGHTDSAAGITGVIKTILSLKSKTLFPTVHFRHANPLIEFENSPVYVTSTLCDWTVEHGSTRRAGVSSFGLSGTNCHLVLEEAPPQLHPQTPVEPLYFIPLSARTSWSLEQNCLKLADWVKKQTNPDLGAIAYTMSAGRTHFSCRRGLLVSSAAELIEKLRAPISAGACSGIKVEKLYFVFSHQNLASLPESEMRKYPLFERHFNHCLSVAESRGHRATSDNVRVFAFQYSFFLMIQDRGLTTHLLIGEGLGDLVIKTITGDLPLEEALDECNTFVGALSNDLLEKCSGFAASLKGAGVLLLEMGSLGRITKVFNEGINAPNIAVCSLRNTPGDPVLDIVKQLYECNYEIPWASVLRNREGYRIVLPTYSFERTRCWIRELSTQRIEDWFYRIHWKESPLQMQPQLPATTLVFMDDGEIGEIVCRQLTQNAGTVVKVFFRENYCKASASRYEIRAGNEADYATMCRELVQDELAIQRILYLSSLGLVTENVLDHSHDRSTLPIFSLLKFFQKPPFARIAALVVGTNAAFVVDRSESRLSPSDSAAAGLVQAISGEFPTLVCRFVDLDIHYSGPEVVVQQLLAELNSAEHATIVGYRGLVRYVPAVRKIDATFAGRWRPPIGTYVITGGLEGPGFQFCQYLSQANPHIRLVVLDTASLPDPETWESYSSERETPWFHALKTFCFLKNRGTSIEYYQVNFDDRDSISSCWKSVFTRFGRPIGIIHAMNFPGKNDSRQTTPLLEYDRTHFAEALGKQIKRPYLLHELLPGAIEFAVFFSSYHGVTASPNVSIISSGNTWLNTFSDMLRQKGINAKVIKWPGWKETSLVTRYFREAQVENQTLVDSSSHEGYRVFEIAMQLDDPNILISKEIIDQAEPQLLVQKSGEVSFTEDRISPPSITSGDPKSVRDQIKSAWLDILKSPNIKDTDDFFEIGGHSLNGTQLINRLQQVFGIKLELEDLFDYPTIEALSVHVLKNTERVLQAVSATDIPRASDAAHYPVTPAQRRFWTLHQIGKDLNAYNMPGTYWITGTFNPHAFCKAFENLVRRHESLRTTFVVVDGEPRQRIHSAAAFNFSVNFQPDAWKRKEGEAMNHIRSETKKVFDLENGPLIKAFLYQIDEQKFLFFFSLHHIIADGWSMEILVNDVMDFYRCEAHGQPLALVELPIQYKDYAVWLEHRLSDPDHIRHHQHWMKVFEKVPEPLRLPVDFQRPAVQSFNGMRLNLSLDQSTTGALKTFSNAHQCTLYMAILGFIDVLLLKLTGQSDIIIGTPISGRTHTKLENQIGLFLNTLLIRTTFDRSTLLAELFNRIRINILKGHEHQEYPFDSLVSELKYERSAARNTLFDVGYTHNVLGTLTESTAEQPDPGFRIEGVTHGFKSVKADLWFHLTELDDRILISLDYNTDLFLETTAVRMLADLEGLVQHALNFQPMTVGQLIDSMLAELKEKNQKIRTNQKNINLELFKSMYQDM